MFLSQEEEEKIKNFSVILAHVAIKYVQNIKRTLDTLYLEQSINNQNACMLVCMTAADDDRKHLLVIGLRNISFKTHTLITHTQIHSFSPSFSGSLHYHAELVCKCFDLFSFSFAYTFTTSSKCYCLFSYLCPVNGI